MVGVGSVSLRGVDSSGIPEETVRIACSEFPRGCLAMRMRHLLGPLFTDGEFAQLYSSRGRPGLSPATLALVSVLQFAEGLTDRQAADAVRGRIDWKYLLGLPLEDQGFDFRALSELRDRLIAGGLEQRLLDTVLDAARASGLQATSQRGTPVTRVRFAARHCGPCPLRARCTTSPTGRNLTLRPREEHEALARARKHSPALNGATATNTAPASRAPSPKPSTPSGRDAPATAATPRHRYNTC
jgi:transposase